MSAPRVFDRTVVAGTFDKLHDGHYAMLHTGFERARHVELWVTDDAMTEAKAKKVGQHIQSFAERTKQLLDWTEAQTPASIEAFRSSVDLIGPRDTSLDGPDSEHPYRGRFTFHELHDPFGPPVTDGSYTSIVCSEETRRGCEIINEKRAENGLAPVEIISIPLILNAKGEKHSSTALRAAAAAGSAGSSCLAAASWRLRKAAAGLPMVVQRQSRCY